MYTISPDRFKNDQITSLKTNQTRDVDKVTFFYELDTALVTHVVTTLDDPEIVRTRDYSKLGAIRCKPVHSMLNQSDEDARWAYPFDPNIKQYPVRNEYVVVGEYGPGRQLFYRTLNTYKNPNHNGNIEFNSMNGVGKGRAESTGDEFPENKREVNILPRQGDTVFQSRFGSAIHFTNLDEANTTSYAPAILISNDVRGTVGTDFIARVEDINRDGSSIYLTSGPQDSRFVPTAFFRAGKDEIPEGSGFEKPTITITDTGFVTSSFDYPSELDGNQILISSDRVVIGSKINETMIFSRGQLGMFSDSKVSIDSKYGVDISTPQSSVRITSGKTYMNSSQVFIGAEENYTQPAVLGSNVVLYLNNVVSTMREFSEILKVAFQSAEKGGQLVIPGLVNMLTQLSTHIERDLLIGEDLRRNLLSDSVYLRPNGGGN